MAKKDRNIIEVTEKDGGKKIGVDSKGKLIEVKETPREGAKIKRIIAICLWLVGIFFEVIGILRLKGVIGWIPSLNTTAFLIIVLVLDCIAVVIGSQFWKKANHIDPASEKNALKFWVQNNLGTIISVIAFLPIILFVLTDKEMDKKNKTIVSVVAVILLLIAGVGSYDFNPVSSEQLERAQKEVLATGNYDTNEDGEAIVYWAEHSKKYHVDKDCPALQNSENVYFGTVKAAYEKKLTEPCRRCIHELEEEHTDEEAK
ncbi:MAG: hypothetical protein IKR57_02175 [Bacilli bacterium]|nr:hypothetical protein [Bacilli bacterium]